MKKIKLINFVDSNSILFREDFIQIREILKLNNKKIILDFNKVEMFSPSSAHELLSILYSFENIKIINLNENLIKILKSQIRLRHIKLDLKDYFLQESPAVLA